MFLYPAWIRFWHLINAVLIILLIITGLFMQFSASHAAGFAWAMRWHNAASVLLIISYSGFVAGNIISDNGKYYRMDGKDISPGLRDQLKYLLHGFFKKEDTPHPVTIENKFNPVRKILYLLIMYIVLPLLILSGLLKMIPDMTIIRIFGEEVFISIDVIHILLGLTLTLFLMIHIYLSTISSKPGSHFRAIISGYHSGD